MKDLGTSLVEQWVGIHWPLHEFNAWSRKIPHAAELSQSDTTTESPL